MSGRQSLLPAEQIENNKVKENIVKKILISLASVVAATAAFAQTNTVLSKNAVGYVRITTEANNPGTLEFISIPFVRLDGTLHAVSNAFPDVPNLTQIIRWDQANQVYLPTYQKAKGSWSTTGTNLFLQGESFFLRSPVSVGQTNYLMGEVPSTGTNSVGIIQGVNFAAHTYPVDVAWTSTVLSASLGNTDQITLWDKTITNYVTYQKAKGTWGAGTNLVIKAGMGFFIRKNTAGSLTWQQTKPYTWP